MWAQGTWQSGTWADGFWPGVSVLPPVETVPGSGQRTPLRPRQGRNARGEILARGAASADLSVMLDAVRAVVASGETQAQADVVRESVRAVVATGESAVRITLSGERVPVFSDDELMALAAWHSRYRH